ncbi:MAG: Bax inhibitor-1/YccA family protein [Rickettsiaceae bacterium]|nr:Bax inhibitor-1/YccA family protein [Rickettsiaceae bacterium]
MSKSTFFESSRKTFDSGLREYMLQIYNYMCAALAISAVCAYSCAKIPLFTSIFYNVAPNGMIIGLSGLGLLAVFSPIAISLYFFFQIGRMNIETAQTLFWAYAACTGVSLSSLGFIYTDASIAKTFLITASTFGAMSIYGYSTKKDLTSMGSFMMMGLIGVVIASLFNLFMQSTALDFALSIVGICIFLGLTAYDTQKLKEFYYRSGGGEYGQKMAIVGAFTLYLDFINLFVYLIRFLGVRKSE